MPKYSTLTVPYRTNYSIKEAKYIEEANVLAVRSHHHGADELPDVVNFINLKDIVRTPSAQKTPPAETSDTGEKIFDPTRLPGQEAMVKYENEDSMYHAKPTGLYRTVDGRKLPIFMAMHTNLGLIDFFTFDAQNGKTEKFASLDNSRIWTNYLHFTGQYKGNDPIFASTLSSRGRDEEASTQIMSFTLDIQKGGPLTPLNTLDTKMDLKHTFGSTGLKDAQGRDLYLFSVKKEVLWERPVLAAVDFKSNTMEDLIDFGGAVGEASVITMHGEKIFVVKHTMSKITLWKYDAANHRMVDFGPFKENNVYSMHKVGENSRGNTVLLLHTMGGDKLVEVDPSFNLKEIGSIKEGEIGTDSVTVLQESPQSILAIRNRDGEGLSIKIVRLDLEDATVEILETYHVDKVNAAEGMAMTNLFFDPDSKILGISAVQPINSGMMSDKAISPIIKNNNTVRLIDLSGAFVDKNKKSLPQTRTGFEALNSDDDLSGLTEEAEMIARYLREKNVELIEEEKSQGRDPSWQTVAQMNKPVSLALMNYFYERNAKEIQKNKGITFEKFLSMIESSRGKNVSDYVNIIRSAIEGQDKTQRAWIRELIQNTRDATRRARERGELDKEKGEIAMRNFTENKDWVFSVRDEGVGMDLWHLIRYFFPLDQSSKDYLSDTGNLGQGNYTLFSDFDRVFIRTSTGNGTIHEIEIVRNAEQGPVINHWTVLKGQYKGAEIRRVKSKETSDPQLESLFIRLAVTNYAGAISSPEDKRSKGLTPDVRDVKITYNGNTFSDKFDVVQSLALGGGWGEMAIGRGEKKNRKRVVQDGIFIKAPDQKELKFVPPWIQAAFERFGGLHVFLPREIQLNIPRTGYSQEHKYLLRLQTAVLHAMMIGVLKDYMERDTRIPGRPPDYFSALHADDNPAAKVIARLMYDGKYDQVSEDMLRPFLANPKDFFELISHIPFTSTKQNGETSLHYIREELIAKAKLRERHIEGTGFKGISLADLFKGHKPSGEFREEIEETVGLDALLGGALEGLLGNMMDSLEKGKSKQTVNDILKSLPPGALDDFEYFTLRILKPIVGEDMPHISYEYNELSDTVAATSKRADGTIRWNLGWGQGRMLENVKKLQRLMNDQEAFKQELQKGEDSFLWRLADTVIHESQHLPKFEQSGDHTHHEDDKVEGFAGKDDRFGARMGRAGDQFLFDLAKNDDALNAFIQDSGKRAAYVKENKARDFALNNPEQNKRSPDKAQVGGIDLNAKNINLKTHGDTIHFKVPPELQYLETTPIYGFAPIIINVIPMSNVTGFLGLNDEGPTGSAIPLKTARAEIHPQMAVVLKQ